MGIKYMCVSPLQVGANVKKFLHLVEEFVNMVGLQMSGFQDIYEVTENLGEHPHLTPLSPLISSDQSHNRSHSLPS